MWTVPWKRSPGGDCLSLCQSAIYRRTCFLSVFYELSLLRLYAFLSFLFFLFFFFLFCPLFYFYFFFIFLLRLYAVFCLFVLFRFVCFVPVRVAVDDSGLC